MLAHAIVNCQIIIDFVNHKVYILTMKIVQEILQTKLNQIINYTVMINLLILVMAFFTYPFVPQEYSLQLLATSLIFNPLLIVFYLTTIWAVIWKWFFNPDKPMREQPLFALSWIILVEATIVMLVILAL